MYFADGDFAQKLLDEEAAAIERRLSELEAEFRASVERRATAVEWRSARSLPVPYLLQQARAADILVIGARPETLVDPSAAPDPSDLVMQAGRPLIVVPQRWNGSTCEAFWSPGRMCAKRGGPYSTRCRFWLPPRKLRLRKFPSRTAVARKRLSHVADVAAWLHGHGITANTVVPEKAGGVTGQIENIAANVGAGAVIAGAYGHSRFREWVLSGVTRHLATESRRCAFLSR